MKADEGGEISLRVAAHLRPKHIPLSYDDYFPVSRWNDVESFFTMAVNVAEWRNLQINLLDVLLSRQT